MEASGGPDGGEMSKGVFFHYTGKEKKNKWEDLEQQTTFSMASTTGVMKDSYINNLRSGSSFIQHESNSSPFAVELLEERAKLADDGKAKADDKPSLLLSGANTAHSTGWGRGHSHNQTDEDKLIQLTCTDNLENPKSTNINTMDEYNKGYSGLSILPWEEFVCNPRVLNELFYAESNQKITFDPDEVNVFFHGKNVMPPTIGDISENGKSWNILIDQMTDLRRIRTLLSERPSVFGVTLEYKSKRFAQPERAPCLVLIDPTMGSIGDKIYTTLTRAMDALHNDKNFCVEINLNGCIERWCRRVLLTDCKAVGAKIVITNGEEYETLDGAEDIVCCIFCFPVWLMQNCIYKLHRKVVYDDFLITFDADDMFLHGAVQDFQCQREYIFTESGSDTVFRTRCAEQTDEKTLQALGSHKFVCIRRVDKSDSDDNGRTSRIKMHDTTTFGDLVNKRKTKVLAKDKKLRKEIKRKDTDSSKYSDRDGAQSDTKGDFSKGAAKANTNGDFTNKAFSLNGPTDDPKDGGNSPRIPEITSVLCGYDEPEPEAIELSIPSELKIDNDCFFSPRTDSSESVLQALPRRKNHKHSKENKSMTAVCSFEFDNGSEYSADMSNSDTDDWSEVEQFTESKDNLLDELTKIDQSLPAVERLSITNNPATSEATDSEAGDVKTIASKVKERSRPGFGKVLKDLTKTTTSADVKENCPTTNDERYRQARDKIRQKKRFGKGRSDTDDSVTNTATTTPVSVPNVTPVELETPTMALDYSIDDSSTDGDEVEMIYDRAASAKRRNVAKGLNVPRKHTDTPSPNTTSGRVSTPMSGNVKSRIIARRAPGPEVDIIYDDDNPYDTERKDKAFAEAVNEGKRNYPLIKPKGLIKVTKTSDTREIKTPIMEEPIALADIDEDGNEVEDGRKTPMRLNYVQKAPKMARGAKRNDSSGKYLGSAVPDKSYKAKKHPR